MGLPSLLPALKKTGTSRSFLALDIGDDTVVAALWRVENGKLVVLLVSDPVDWSDDDGGFGLPEAADTAIGELGESAEKVNEVLLGLPESWTSNGLIIPDRKKQLKEVRDQLGLKLLGFAVSGEALIKYIALLDGVAVSAVLVQVTKASLKVGVVKDGVPQQTEIVGRSDDFAGDMTEALARVKELQPEPRMLFYGMKFSVDELNTLVQTIKTHDWIKGGFFHKTPAIETLPNDVLVTAVCLTAGREVATGLGLIGGDGTLPTQSTASTAKTPVSPQEPKFSMQSTEVTHIEKPEANISPKESSFPMEGDNFGFSELPFPTKEQEEHSFVDNRSAVETAYNIEQPISTEDFGPGVSELDGVSVKTTRLGGFFRKLSFGKSITERHAAEATGKKPVGIFLFLIVVLFIGLLGGGYAYVKQSYTAQVIIDLQTSAITKNLQLKLSPSVEKSDPFAKVVKVADASEEVSGEKEGESTGTKIVGDKAKGKIKFFNRTATEKAFPAKTSVSYKGLKFTTDEPVTIPAYTTGSGYTNVPGTAEVAVTAVEIGPESNLSADSELTIANFDTAQYVAKAEVALKGGSSREILAVSEADVTRVSEALAKELQAQVVSKLQANAINGKTVISAGKPTIQKLTVSPKVGEESKTFRVSLTMDAKGVAYSAEDLTPVGEAALQAEVPEKSALRPESMRLSVLNASASATGEIIADVELTAELIPFVDREAIAESIRGVLPGTAQGTVRSQIPVHGVKVQFSPSFAGVLFGKLPDLSRNIDVQVHLGGP